MEPATIAALLRELAVYYELDGDRHRAFAYDRAAKSVEPAKNLARLIDEGRLDELPGVGQSIARVIVELAKRGTIELLDKMREKWPPVVIELAQLPKVGVTKARYLFEMIPYLLTLGIMIATSSPKRQMIGIPDELTRAR